MHSQASTAAVMLYVAACLMAATGAFFLGGWLALWAAATPEALWMAFAVCTLAGTLGAVCADRLWRRLGPSTTNDSDDDHPATRSALTAEILRLTALDRAVFDTAADGIMVINPSGAILKANNAAHQMFRARAGSLLGMNVSRLMPQPHRDQHDGYIERHMQTGEKRIIGSTRELQAQRLDGEVFPIELSVASTRLEDKTYFTGFVRDVSTRTQLEAELAQAERFRSVGQLASGIAHEMNTPLQYIRINSEYLESSMCRLVEQIDRISNLAAIGTHDELADLKQNVSECLSENLKGLEHVIGIVDAMKEFAHPGPDTTADFNLNDCVTSAGRVSSNHWRWVADLVLELAPDLPSCSGNANEACQAMLNLLVNAADAIKDERGEHPTEKGQITVRTRHDCDWITVEIENDGPSIPPSLISRIFDPFFTTKPVGKGTGQGLAIT
ncbi:MAG: PAS domain S-box protein, partial [Planctomycetales bacterium]|nr:PAS domain S-box protein [Planctomycetales bacterium]